MATLGYTKLEAINAVLLGLGESRITALDTGGSSLAGDVEYYFDIADRTVQSMGWAENTDYIVSYTPSGGPPLKVQVASTVLAVRGAGRSRHRTFTLRGDYVYDVDNQSDEFSSATAIYLDVVSKIPFINLAPSTKEVVVAYATLQYQMAKRGDVRMTAFHSQMLAIADAVATRPTQMPRPAINPVPTFAAIPAPNTNA